MATPRNQHIRPVRPCLVALILNLIALFAQLARCLGRLLLRGQQLVARRAQHVEAAPIRLVCALRRSGRGRRGCRRRRAFRGRGRAEQQRLALAFGELVLERRHARGRVGALRGGNAAQVNAELLDLWVRNV